MNDNKLVEKNIIDLRSKVMLKKIDKLHETFQILKNFPNEVKTLLAIKEQYLKMYNEMLEREAYEKYPDIENVIVDVLAKLEIRIETYLYNTIFNFEKIVLSRIEDIRKSESYQNFKDLDSNLKDIEQINKLMNLYNNYVSKNEMEKVKIKLSEIKFEVLYRKQVEELIYEFGGSKSNLSLYENEQEKEIFEKSLQNIINIIKSSSKNEYIRSDKLFDVSIEQILNDSNLLERLIILDMKTHPFDYINLVKAKIFNAHLCNIGDNPFEKDIKSLISVKVNYSLLEAILRNIITDEDISILECENLYKRFGFKCRPILTNIGQQCVYMIFNDVYKNISLKITKTRLKREKQKENGQYCKIDFEGLIYRIDPKKESSYDVLEQILNKRFVRQTDTEMKKKTFFFLRQEEAERQVETERQVDWLQEVKKKGIVTVDINEITLLIKALIAEYSDKIQELGKKEDKEVEAYRKKIITSNRQIESLEKLKNKKLTLEEERQLLLLVQDVYEELSDFYLDYSMTFFDPRKFIPLENMRTQDTIYQDNVYRKCYKSAFKPSWKKYQKEFEDLGINIKKYRSYIVKKKYDRYYEDEPRFDICINLDDISDLPINYDKVQLLTKEELQEIIERENENER